MNSLDLKQKVVCFVDNGLFVSFARTAAKGFGKAYYYKPYQSAFVRSNDIVIGRGFDEFEVIQNPLSRLDEIDLFVFLDLYQADLQEHLRSLGKRVWGSGIGEEMELRRWEFKQHLKRIGLPVQPCEHIFGFDKLREFLKTHENRYVKTSFTRGDFETFRHDNYTISEQRLDDLQHVLGAKGKTYEFIVEEEIKDAVEVGYDGFVVDGMYPSHAMIAYEIKDCGMVGTAKLYSDLAAPVKLVNTKLAPTFKADEYRGFFCSEIRYTKKGEAYMIDPCCRLGTPSNELLQVLFEGWPETLWYGAEGKMVSPKVKNKFGVLAMLVSEFATTDWLSVDYGKELDEWVKLRFHTRVSSKNGFKNYVVPQVIGIPDIGCVVGVGETLDGAVKDCKEKAKGVKGFQLHANIEAIDKGLAVIKEGEKFGIKF